MAEHRCRVARPFQLWRAIPSRQGLNVSLHLPMFVRWLADPAVSGDKNKNAPGAASVRATRPCGKFHAA